LPFQQIPLYDLLSFEYEQQYCVTLQERDSTRLASASYDNKVKIWDTSSGKCLQTLEVGKMLSDISDISFDITGLYLHTNLGTIVINASSASYTTPIVTKLEALRYQGGGLSSDGAWITYNSENVVWLPSEYRPSCSAAVSAKAAGIGVRSGKVRMCSFNAENGEEMDSAEYVLGFEGSRSCLGTTTRGEASTWAV
jgi:hypothetical protein